MRKESQSVFARNDFLILFVKIMRNSITKFALLRTEVNVSLRARGRPDDPIRRRAGPSAEEEEDREKDREDDYARISVAYIVRTQS